MRQNSSHIIENATFQFNYEGRKVATRCNDHIETIFQSHIFPVLQEVVVQSIPQEASFTVEKLEIDIGYIREKEFTSMLLNKIKGKLKMELFRILNIRNNTGRFSTIKEEQFITFTNDAILLFLSKGYFPHWISSEISVDQLVQKSIEQHPERFLSMLRGFATNEIALKRLIINSSLGLSQDVIQKLEPTQCDWIKKYSKWLVDLFKSQTFFKIPEKRLAMTLDLLMLQFVLGRNSLIFDRRSFSEYVLNGISSTFYLTKESITNLLPNTETIGVSAAPFYKLLKEYSENTKVGQEENSSQSYFTTDRIKNLLNIGLSDISIDFKTQLLKEITLLLRDEQEREKFVIQLSDQGLSELIAQFYKGDIAMIRELVIRLVKLSNSSTNKVARATEGSLILRTLNHLSHRSNDQISTSIFLAIIINELQLSAAAFEDKKFQTLLKIDGLEYTITPKNTLYARGKGFVGLRAKDDFYKFKKSDVKKIHTPVTRKTNQELIQIYRKQLLDYLTTGVVEEEAAPFKEDVQVQFTFLMEMRDDFLVHLIVEGDPSGNIQKRIEKLYNSHCIKTLQIYLIHKFPEETAVFKKLTELLETQINQESDALRLFKAPKFFTITLLKVLFETRGARYPKTLEFAMRQSMLVSIGKEKILAYLKITESEQREIHQLLKKENFQGEVVAMYLLEGRKTAGDTDNAKSDLLQAFSTLIADKDKFLADILTKYTFHQEVFERLLRLIASGSVKEVLSYLKYYFPKEMQAVRSISGSFSGFRESRINKTPTKKTAVPIQKISSPISGATQRNTVCEALIFGLLHTPSGQSLTRFEVVVYEFLENKLKPREVKNDQEEGQKSTRSKEKNKIEKSAQEATKGETADGSSASVQQLLSVITFYIQRGFLPWWSEVLALEDITKKVKSFGNREIEYFKEKLNDFLNINLLRKKQGEGKELKFSRKRNTYIVELLNFLNTQNAVVFGSTDTPGKLAQSLGDKAIHLSNVSKREVWDEKALYELLYRYSDAQLQKAYWGTEKGGLETSHHYLGLAKILSHYGIPYSTWRTAYFTFLLQRPRADRRKLNKYFHTKFLYYLTTRYSKISWYQIFNDIYLRCRQEPYNEICKLPEGLEPLVAKNAQEINNNKTDDFMENDMQIAIRNAGLIILGAYLTPYFERLGLTANGSFIDRIAQNRAVYLLQHLVWNTIEVPEHDLVLNKILVGMELETLVTPIELLRPDETDLSRSLLQGIINNWERMDNSTPLAIQETFFQRDGLLQFKDEHIELTVERRGVDILMERINWNISILNLPWMDRPLHIIW